MLSKQYLAGFIDGEGYFEPCMFNLETGEEYYPYNLAYIGRTETSMESNKKIAWLKEKLKELEGDEEKMESKR